MVNIAGNIAALQADDVYVQNVAPPTFIQAADTDVIGVVGTASWGAVNQAQFLSSQQDATATFGGISALALTDPYDIASDLYLAFGQNNQDGTVQGFGVRVTDGTDTAATGALLGTGNIVSATVTAVCTGVLGNLLTLNVAAGYVPGTFTVTLTPPAQLGQSEVFANIAAGTFFANLAAAINLGQSTSRGPSEFIRLSGVYAGTRAPLLATVTLSGGTDGRTGVTTTKLIGANQSSGGSTGIWALQGTDPGVSLAWLAGCTDETGAPTVQAFTAATGISALFAMPSGTSTPAAQAAAQAAGIASPYFAWCKDWIYWNDGVNGQLRFTPPTAVIMGRIATLGPEESPGNKGVQLVIGTERMSPSAGTVAYTDLEVGLLEQAGIMLITNPIPAGSAFGIRHGITTSSDPVTAPFEYGRMTTYLARSANSVFGQFVDMLQSTQPDDPLRQAVKLSSDNFLTNLVGLDQIDSFLTICSLNTAAGAAPGYGVNTPVSIAEHYLFHMWRVKYLSSVRFFVLSLQGGTTVVTVQSSVPGSQQT